MSWRESPLSRCARLDGRGLLSPRDRSLVATRCWVLLGL